MERRQDERAASGAGTTVAAGGAQAARGDARALDWNLVVTAREGRQRELRSALGARARVQRSGFRNVLVGRADDVAAFLEAVAVQRERQPFLDNWLARILPIERTFRVDVARLDEVLREETAPLLDRLAGRSFHVRVERRGHKGLIHTHLTEQALGEHLCNALKRRGAQAVIDFQDPDVVVAVELLGDVGGIGLVTRELRRRFPFVRID